MHYILSCIIFHFFLQLQLIAGSQFFNIFQNNGILGIAKNEPLLAIATKKSIIFGNFSDNLYFAEINRFLINPLFTQSEILLEFKFIDKSAVVICEIYGCSYCEAYEKLLFQPGCINLHNTYMKSVTVQKGYNNTIFLKYVELTHTLEGFEISDIYSKKFNNTINMFENVGIAEDRGSILNKFKAIYSFSYNKHVYFISYIRRQYIFTKPDTFDIFSNPIHNDIVITQICENDESEDIISRMDLVLTCDNIKNLVEFSTEDINEHSINVAFLPKNEILLLSFEDSKNISTFCKFKMKDIETQFQHTWDYCQNITQPEKNCTEKNYSDLADNECLKIGWRNSYEQILPCKKFNSQSKNTLLNSCQAAETLVEKDNRNGWLENIQPFNGKIIEKSSNFSYWAFYPHSNGKDLFILKNNSFVKMSENYSTTGKLEYNFKNSKIVIPWDSKNGILYVDPISMDKIYFKDFSCNKNECHEILYTDPLNCEYCKVDEKNECKSIHGSTLRYCAPVWYKNKYSKNFFNTTKYHINEYFNVTHENNTVLTKRINCKFITTKIIKNCTKSVDEQFDAILTGVNDRLSSNRWINVKQKPVIKQKDFSIIFLVAIIVPLIAVLGILGFGIGIYLYRKKRNAKMVTRAGHILDPSFIHMNDSTLPIIENGEINEENVVKIIKKQQIKFIKKLGEGYSSNVHLADYINNSATKKVAVKTFKKPYMNSKILKEMEFLQSCNHKNIVQLIGQMKKEGKYCVITEFMEGGDLCTYLKDETQPLTLTIISSYIFQVLDAMIYLSHKHILHRDLAARNCLLDKNFTILKITDFGVSREMDKNYEYISERGCELPFRWLPPEALFQGIFTIKGDVWSFAVLIWEMFERGAEPYGYLNFQGVKDYLNAKDRLSRQQHCPLKLYNVMKSCWKKDAEQRPNFESLKRDIKIIFNKIATEKPMKLTILIR